MGKTFIISECGINHNGNIETAKRLIEFSKWAGADAVKFQMWGVNTFPDLKHLVFSPIAYNHIFAYCESISIKWFCTPFDINSVNFLDDLGMTIWKIPSNRTVLDNKEMLEAISKIENKKRLIISCGAFDVKAGGGLEFYSDIEKLLKRLNAFKTSNLKIDILYCISKYPTLPTDYNLRKIITMKNWLPFYGCNIGLSDHSATISIPVAAVALGATVIEKHITLDRNQIGEDHKASIEPAEFKDMVKMIREIEKAIN